MKLKSMAVAVAAILLFTLCAVPVSAEESAVITSFEISPSGVAELIGYVSAEGEQVAVLMTEGDGSTVTPETVIYIDQIEARANGAFILEFIIPDKWENIDYTVAIAGTNSTITKVTGDIGVLPELIHRVDNNSLRVGCDIYSFGVSAFTPENTATSLAAGGNEVYYKIGGMWFDLQSEAATSSAYLVAENAVPEEEYTAWEIRTYYAPGQTLEGV